MLRLYMSTSYNVYVTASKLWLLALKAGQRTSTHYIAPVHPGEWLNLVQAPHRSEEEPHEKTDLYIFGAGNLVVLIPKIGWNTPFLQVDFSPTAVSSPSLLRSNCVVPVLTRESVRVKHVKFQYVKKPSIFHFAQRFGLSGKGARPTRTFAQKRWPRLPHGPKVSAAAAARTALQRAPRMPASSRRAATGAPM